MKPWIHTTAAALALGAMLTSGARAEDRQPRPVLASPVGLQVQDLRPNQLVAGGNSVRLSWVDTNSAETGHEVQTSTDGVAWVVHSSAPANTTSVTLSGLTLPSTPAEQWHVRVRATEPAFPARAPGQPGIHPGQGVSASLSLSHGAQFAPTGVAVAAIGATGVRLQWRDTNVYESGYEVQVSQDGGSVWTVAAQAPLAAALLQSTEVVGLNPAAAVAGSLRLRVRPRGLGEQPTAVGQAGSALHVSGSVALPSDVLRPVEGLALSGVRSQSLAITWVDTNCFEAGHEAHLSYDGVSWVVAGTMPGAAGPQPSMTVTGIQPPVGSTVVRVRVRPKPFGEVDHAFGSPAVADHVSVPLALSDSDADGTVDVGDGCPNDALKTQPGTCGCGVADTDTDGDGTADCNDQCPNDAAKTAPGVCGCGTADLDSDNDGALDCNDGCPNDALKTQPGTCGCGVADTDTDGDGTADCNDQCPNDAAKTAPGVCGCGTADLDSDNDGTLDCNDGCPSDALKTQPGTCGCGVADTDTDGDGTADCNDQCPNDAAKTAPGVCGCGTADVDSDNDGTLDCNDGCPSDALKTQPGTCGCGVAETDTDGDGTADCNDQCPNDAAKTAPGVCGCGTADIDSDNDGTLDCNDGCPNDALKTQPGTCGCGVADTDTDGDGTADCTDQCPNDAAKTAPGVCGCGVADLDSDNDGTLDCNDGCPSDALKTQPGTCGCGVAETDTDGDGTADCNDQCPNDAAKTEPGVCGCGTADVDSDNDGTLDCNDGCPNDALKTQPGTCGCGVADTDTDGDGTADCNDQCPNDAAKTVPGVCGCGTADLDSDNDGTLDCNDGCPNDALKTQPGTCGCGVADTDTDGDGTADCNDQCPNDAAKTAPGVCGCGTADVDSDNDGTLDCDDGCPSDALKTQPGTCGCGVADTDTDGDGTADCNDQCPNDALKTQPGTCGCGVPDTDTDGDGTADCNDQCPNDAAKTAPGVCGCGTADIDSDNDGTLDCNDGCPNDALKTQPGTCGCGVADTDADGDGAADCNDQCPYDAAKTAPGVCGCGTADVDSDNDGTLDCNDGCPSDALKTQPGTCGCGVADTDTDGDSTADCNDQCPNDAAKTAPGVCGCGTADVDSDNDGTLDCNDGCPSDVLKTQPGTCGCGVADTDTDGDGTADCNDQCPNDAAKTAPGVCGCGTTDIDSDNDGTLDCNDGCPNDALKTQLGTCGCGVADTDTDGDGTADCTDQCPNDAAKTAPGVCGCGTADVDSDNDGTLDCNDGCPSDALKTQPGTCGCGVADTDTDGDSTADCNDQCPNDAAKTAPGVCGCGTADVDSDNDGTLDCNDGCPSDVLKTQPGTCGCGVADTDTDGDGTADCNDQCPNDPAKTAPGVCGCGTADVDSDNDGTLDCNDGCPSDALKTQPGTCGCGVADTDTDGDGTADCNDQCPNDAAKTAPGVCGCGTADIDSDNDGTLDCNDGCPNDALKTQPGTCGCGVAETDTDGDGTADCNDQCPNDAAKTAPGVCGCGVADVDSDNDGALDCNDGCPNDALKTQPGTCGCGVADTDTDGDGTADCNDQCPNDAAKTQPGTCGCGVDDTDTDGDGTANCNDQCPSDAAKTAPGVCGCGVADVDSDNDGTLDCNDGCPSDALKTQPGTCGCGVPDTDTDGDGTADCNDQCPNDAAKTAPGVCGCGTADVDSDNDRTLDCNDGCPNDALKTQPGTCGCGVADTIAPVISQCPPATTLHVMEPCRALVPDFTGQLVATAGCGGLLVSQLPAANTEVGLGSTAVVLTATNAAGNADTCTVLLTVVDTTAPRITTCAPEQTVNASADCQGVVPDVTALVVTADTCDSSLIITQSPPAGSMAPLGGSTITITVADDAGNTSSCPVGLTVLDSTDPTFTTCAQNQSAPATLACGALLPDFSASAIAADNCDSSIVITQSPAAGTAVTTGVTTVTLTATDDAGNTATCTATFTVSDTTAPTFTSCASAQTVSAGAACTALIPSLTAAVATSDACVVTVTQSPLAGSVVTIGVHTVTITATDAFGNSSTCEARVTVADTDAPVVTSCAPTSTLIITASNSTNCQIALPDLRNLVSASDSCGIVERSQDPAAETLVGAGSHSVLLTLHDQAGNTTQCTTVVEVSAANADGDALPDCADGCPNDPLKTAPGGYGCGRVDLVPVQNLTLRVLSFVPGSSVLELAWTDTNSGEAGYELQASVDGGAWMLKSTVPANATSGQVTGLTMPDLAQGQSLALRVRSVAVNPQPTDPLTVSPSVSVTFDSLLPATDLAVLEVVLSPQSTTAGELVLTWSDTNIYESGYETQVSYDDGVTWAVNAEVGADVRTARMQGLSLPGIGDLETVKVRVRTLPMEATSQALVHSTAYTVSSNSLVPPTHVEFYGVGPGVAMIQFRDTNAYETAYEAQTSTDGVNWVVRNRLDTTPIQIQNAPRLRGEVTGVLVPTSEVNGSLHVRLRPVQTEAVTAPGTAVSSALHVSASALFEVSAQTPVRMFPPAGGSYESIAADGFTWTWTDTNIEEAGYETQYNVGGTHWWVGESGGRDSTKVKVTVPLTSLTGVTGSGPRMRMRTVGPGQTLRAPDSQTPSAIDGDPVEGIPFLFDGLPLVDNIPAAPSALWALPEDVNLTSVRLVWADQSSVVNQEHGFEIERLDPGEDPNDAAAWNVVGRIGTDGQINQAPATQLVTGLLPSTTYKFRVVARRLGPWAVSTAQVASSGTGYALNQELTCVGQASTSARVRVTQVNAQGGLVTVALVSGGQYADNAARTLPVSGGTGAGATVLLTMAAPAQQVRFYSLRSNAVTVQTATPVTTPVNLRTSSFTTDAITVAWDRNTYANGYQVRWRRAGTTAWTVLPSSTTYLPVDTTVQSVGGLLDAELYEFQVRGSNNSTSSPILSEWSASHAQRTRPTPPVNLALVSRSATEVSLRWTPTSTRATHIRVQRSADAGVTWTTMRDIYAPSTTGDSNYTTDVGDGLAANSRQHFRVRALWADTTSGADPELAVPTIIGPVSDPELIVDLCDPLATPVITSTPLTTTSISVQWAAVPQATKYRLFIDRKDGLGLVNITGVDTFLPATPTNYTATGLVEGVGYDFQLRAYRDNVEPSVLSPLSSIVRGYTYLSAPAAVSVAPLGLTGLRVSWTDMSRGETQFRVRRTNGGDLATWSSAASVVTSATSLATNGTASFDYPSGDDLWPNSQYRLRVIAVLTDTNGTVLAASVPLAQVPESNWPAPNATNAVLGSTQPLPAPTNLRLTTRTASTIAVQWDGVGAYAGFYCRYKAWIRSEGSTTWYPGWESALGWVGTPAAPDVTQVFTRDALVQGIANPHLAAMQPNTRKYIRVQTCWDREPTGGLPIDVAGNDPASFTTEMAVDLCDCDESAAGPTPSVVAAQSTPTSLRVQWPSVPGATDYRVFLSSTSATTGFTNISGANGYLAPLGGATQSTTITGLSEGTQYWLKVRAFNLAVVPTYNTLDSVVVSDYTPLVAPDTFSHVPVGASGFRVQWVDRSQVETGYEVRRYQLPSGPWTPWIPVAGAAGTGTQLSYVFPADGTTWPGTNYDIQVRAVKTIATGQLASNEALGAFVAGTAPLPLPTNLRVTSRRLTCSPSAGLCPSATLAWDLASLGEGFVRYRAEVRDLVLVNGVWTATGPWVVGHINPLTNDNNQIFDGSLNPDHAAVMSVTGTSDTRKRFRVQVFWDRSDTDTVIDVAGGYSEVLDVDLADPLDPPTTITVNPLQTSMDISWSAVAGASNYRLLAKGPNDAAFVNVLGAEADLPSGVRNYTMTGLVPGQTWEFKVRAVHAAVTPPVESALSAAVVSRTAPVAPTGFRMVPGSATLDSMQLEWVDVAASETAYNIAIYIGPDNPTLTDLALDANWNGPYAQTAAGSGTMSVTVTGLTPLRPYWWRIRAIDQTLSLAGTGPVVHSQTGPATFASFAFGATLCLCAPTGLAVVSASNSAVTIRWVDNSSFETDYQVQRSLTYAGVANPTPAQLAAGTWSGNATVAPANSTQATWNITPGSPLTSGTFQWFRVRPRNGATLGDPAYIRVTIP